MNSIEDKICFSKLVRCMIRYFSTSNAKFAIWFIGVFKRTLRKFLFNELAKSSHFNFSGCGRPKVAGKCLAKD